MYTNLIVMEYGIRLFKITYDGILKIKMESLPILAGKTHKQ